MKDEECARATAELDFWRETQRKTVEENENQQKTPGTGTHDNQPVYQKTERANAPPAVTLMHNTGDTTSGKHTLTLCSITDLMLHCSSQDLS